MNKMWLIGFIGICILSFISCDNQMDGGHCEYETVLRRVNVTEIEKDSVGLQYIEFQIFNTQEKIRVGNEDLKRMNLDFDWLTFENDTLSFLLEGEENTAGACQPYFWKKLTIQE